MKQRGESRSSERAKSNPNTKQTSLRIHSLRIMVSVLPPSAVRRASVGYGTTYISLQLCIRSLCQQLSVHIYISHIVPYAVARYTHTATACARRLLLSTITRRHPAGRRRLAPRHPLLEARLGRPQLPHRQAVALSHLPVRSPTDSVSSRGPPTQHVLGHSRI